MGPRIDIHNYVISRMAIVPKGAWLWCRTMPCLGNEVSSSAYHMDHPHSATCLFKLSSRSPSNMHFNSPLKLWPQGMITMIQLIVKQLSLKTVLSHCMIWADTATLYSPDAVTSLASWIILYSKILTTPPSNDMVHMTTNVFSDNSMIWIDTIPLYALDAMTSLSNM